MGSPHVGVMPHNPSSHGLARSADTAPSATRSPQPHTAGLVARVSLGALMLSKWMNSRTPRGYWIGIARATAKAVMRVRLCIVSISAIFDGERLACSTHVRERDGKSRHSLKRESIVCALLLVMLVIP